MQVGGWLMGLLQALYEVCSVLVLFWVAGVACIVLAVIALVIWAWVGWKKGE